jgi:hypothetical protein
MIPLTDLRYISPSHEYRQHLWVCLMYTCLLISVQIGWKGDIASAYTQTVKGPQYKVNDVEA